VARAGVGMGTVTPRTNVLGTALTIVSTRGTIGIVVAVTGRNVTRVVGTLVTVIAHARRAATRAAAASIGRGAGVAVVTDSRRTYA
jgi:hypothetical protein